jgi:hypothetical protein
MGRLLRFGQHQVQLELWPRVHPGQVPLADEHRLEERSCQAVPLGRVGVVPGGTSVEQL